MPWVIYPNNTVLHEKGDWIIADLLQKDAEKSFRLFVLNVLDTYYQIHRLARPPSVNYTSKEPTTNGYQPNRIYPITLHGLLCFDLLLFNHLFWWRNSFYLPTFCRAVSLALVNLSAVTLNDMDKIDNWLSHDATLSYCINRHITEINHFVLNF